MRLYVLCPAQVTTGGPEALHQLVDAAVRLGFDARIVYYPPGAAPLPDRPKPALYDCYRTPVARWVDDAPDCVVVCPETEVHRLVGHHLATKVLWWLSVDNFTSRAELVRRAHKAAVSPLDAVYRPDLGLLHAAQSEYARVHLRGRGVSPVMLTDYLRPEVVELAAGLAGRTRGDVVAYNPSKGLEFTRQLVRASPRGLTWVPLQGLSPAELVQVLGSAKVYVDFGNHPGRDRIPREAALAGALVVTGRAGSAGNPVDVPIDEQYKVDTGGAGAVRRALAVVSTAVAEYERRRADFAAYRTWVLGQQDSFRNEVFMLAGGLEARRRHSVLTGL